MSLYSCIDLIDNALLTIGNATDSVSVAHVMFLQALRQRLQRMDELSNYEDLNTVRSDIQDYLNQTVITLSEPIRELLSEISLDLKSIGGQITSEDDLRANVASILSKFKALVPTLFMEKTLPTIPIDPAAVGLAELNKDLHRSRFVIKNFSQKKDLPVGLSQGECYGLVKSMADTSLSIYNQENPDKTIVFNRVVYAYQRSQYRRTEDLKGVKVTRLTREYFCPSLREQAEALYEQAKAHEGKDLYIRLRGKLGLHATYLSLQDGKIRYMDPDFGAFLFENKKQFMAAYRTMNKVVPHPFAFYSVSLLKEDKQETIPDSHTLAGMVRSLFTGTKYDQLGGNWRARLLNGVIGTSIGMVVGGLIGTFIFPVIGTIICSAVAGLIGGLLSYNISKKAESHRHFGLMGPYHWMREQLSGTNNENDDLQTLREDLQLESAPRDSYHHTLSKLSGSKPKSSLADAQSTVIPTLEVTPPDSAERPFNRAAEDDTDRLGYKPL